MWPALVASVGKLVSDTIGEFVEDPDERNRLQALIRTRVEERAQAALQGQIDIILAESRGESWLQRTWRPILMLVIVAVVANNYLIAPYAQAIFGVGLNLGLPDRLWDLMTLGVGGYIAGRSGEKIVERWKQ